MHYQSPQVTQLEQPPTASQQAAGRSSGLPDDLLRAAAKRLRIIAIVFAAGFLLGELIPVLFDPLAAADIVYFHGWGPPVISIAVALSVAFLVGNPRLSPKTLMNIGLGFEVVGAYGIAFSMYWGVYRGLVYEPEHLGIFGLSFVAPWIMFFTIVAPNEPRKALLAAFLSSTSVPVVLLLTMRYGGTSIVFTTGHWLGAVVVPYGMIVLTAYIGARVVHGLGTAVKRAREMGSYRLTEQLGEGGMGEVWRAEHRMLARPAAIKLVKPDMLGSVDAEHRHQTLKRFEREAQATALMRSPNTIELYDFGVTEDGTFYYVMELLDGYDLETLVNRFGPVPPERAVHLLCQVCDSLAEAHQSGLIHRDIKPANIYLCRHGRKVDVAKVLDFGMVKSRHDSEPDDVKLTADHSVFGTPAFMAPEQVLGNDDIDGRTDIYAVGCVAYWILTGRYVFQSRTVPEMMALHLREPPEPPSAHSQESIPEALEELVLACLAKDRADRPQSADELAARLAASQTAAEWTSERAQEWWSTHPATVGS
jgi:serine/threonine-protein kinase